MIPASSVVTGLTNRPVVCSHIAVEQWASHRYTPLAGGEGGGSCEYQEHICDMNSSMCRTLTSSTVQSTSAMFDFLHLQTIWLSCPNFLHLHSTVSMQQQQSLQILYVFYALLLHLSSTATFSLTFSQGSIFWSKTDIYTPLPPPPLG